MTCALVAIVGIAAVLTGATTAGAAPEKWRDRVIPLPKEMEVTSSVTLPASAIALRCEVADSPAVTTARGLISEFAQGAEDSARFTVRMALTNGSSGRLAKRLSSLPNSDQAYAITPNDEKGLLLLANTPWGLLYAARTLRQLVGGEKLSQYARVEVPLARVVDWPDIAERGQWGGDVSSRLQQTSQYKLNVIEESAGVEVDSAGNASAKIDRRLFETGDRLGVKIVPFILHLEQLSRSAKLSKDVTSTPDPSKPLPSDYYPGLCMSSPATRKLVASWIEKIAEIPQVTDIMVWLSEDRAPCFCENCRGKEPFELEVACITGAFREVQARHERIRLRLLTTQGSYPVNDRIIAAAPADVGITYYDGGRTYDSSRSPMIYPLLEEFSRSGRWLGVYPQITHSWRCVFPWTGPQSIQCRAREFADKKLSCVIGYAVPGNKYHEFNVAALAEWTWNSRGRSVEDFCRAWALKTGKADPEVFSRWAMLVGDAGWSLAESRLFLSAIYNPTLGLGSAPFDHRFQNASISKPKNLESALREARESLELAHKSGDEDMVCESECVLAGLEAFEAIRAAYPLLSSESVSEQDRKTLAESLDRLDDCAGRLRSRLLEWGTRVSGGTVVPGRLLDTAFALLRTCDAYRQRAAAIGVPDPSPELRPRKLREWTAADFANGPETDLRMDITDLVPEAGCEAQVRFDFTESAYGTTIRKVEAVLSENGKETVAATSPDVSVRVGRHERDHELRLSLPKRSPGTRLFLRVSLSGLPADAPEDRRSCSGAVSLRLVKE